MPLLHAGTLCLLSPALSRTECNELKLLAHQPAAFLFSLKLFSFYTLSSQGLMCLVLQEVLLSYCC